MSSRFAGHQSIANLKKVQDINRWTDGRIILLILEGDLPIIAAARYTQRTKFNYINLWNEHPETELCSNLNWTAFDYYKIMSDSVVIDASDGEQAKDTINHKLQEIK